MTMESPVRICLGAALVVNLLLLASTARGNALPHEPVTTVKDERQPRLSRNSTWVPSTHKPTPDVALNELHPKESVSESEEHTEKNAKYKHRGRVRFHSQLKSSTESNLRRIRTSSPSTSTTTLAPKSASEAAKLIIVTPTPEVKKPAQIIDSMRIYKRTKMPVSSSSTTISTPEAVELDTEEEEYDDEDDKEEEDDVKDDRDNFEKYLTSKFPDSNFFTIPSYNDDFSHDSDSADNKLKSHYKKPHDKFSSYFPDISYGPSTKDDPYKAESFFNFDSELTTPKNDFFDKKFEEISKGIIKNLEASKTKVPQPNETVFKVIKENTGLEKLTNGTPTNKSTVIIKNTKEIRLLDNEHASSDPKALSDVQGTSIYYEMSVLSTETYNINHTNDDDCDNDTGPEPTISTSADEELASVKATQSSLATASTKASIASSSSQYVSTLSSNYFPFSSAIPTYFSTVIPELTVYSTETVGTEYDKTRTYSSSFSRNRNYSKRLNFNEVKDSPNNVTPRGEHPLSNQSIRQNTRKFAYTTPKTKPIWMAPRRNATRTSYTRTTTPRTIYSEHFNIKDKRTTNLPRQPSRSTLTTVSSEIDPVKEGDVSGVKKIVHSPSISDNSIPSLWKRGSTKYATSTATSKEEEGSGINDLEIPPTLTAWALASLRSPPHQPSAMVNASTSTHKSVDENELQKVGEVADKKETTTSSSATKTTTNSINNDILPKITEIVQNKLPWRPGLTSKVITEKPSESSDSENKSESLSENKSESLPAESNLSLQSSVKPASTTEELNVEATKAPTTSESPETTETESKDSEKFWVSATEESLEKEQTSTENLEVIPPVDATKSTGFESITKLPAGITTPQDETITSSEDKTEAVTKFKQPTTATENTAPVTIPTTTDYEITTIRFSYVPTQADTESTVQETTMSSWHPVFPTRTKTTTIKDEPVTTYRPKFMTTTDSNEEITTTIPESSSQESTSQKVDIITEISVESNSEESTPGATIKSTTKSTSTPKSVSADTTESSQETTTIIVEVITEINTEREKSKSSSTESSSETDTNESDTPPSEIRESSSENSGSNEVITQENKVIVTTPKSKTTTEEKTTQSNEELTTVKDLTTQGHVFSVTTVKEDSPEELETVKSATETDEEMGLTSEATTETSRLGGPEEAGSGAAVAIAVSTIGVIALILLVGLLLVVRRRGRRGVYAQRCTPVSLDAYSLDSVSVGHRKGNHRLRASKRSYGNPAYDDEVTSHPMPYAALANFALDIESMTAEFSEIPSVTVKPDEVPPGCEDKNRYSNVLPLPETRVPLKRIGNDPTTEYINANYITGPGNIRNYYIACQAPLPNTVMDFWRMIWEQNSRVIVMLTEYMENGVEKCYEYLPPSEISDNRRIFGDFKIVLMKREQKDKYAISSVQLINTATRTWREVTHLWYFWPAKGVPDDYDSVIDFLSEMRSHMKISQTAKEYDEEGVEVIYGDQSRSSFHSVSKLRSDENGSGNGVNVYSPARVEEQLKRGTNGTLGRMKTASEIEAVRPCVVVCASGAGRSAAIIAADICARALAAAAADVPRVVRELRAQRPHSLSNRHHYIFLYKVLAEYGNKLMGGGVDTI